MQSIFDKPYDFRHTDSDKWLSCQNGEIPMWVAEMDFDMPEPIITALKQRLNVPHFGYSDTDAGAFRAIIAHYQALYGSTIEYDWLMTAPTVIPAVYAGCLAAGGRVMYCTPMYTHIRKITRDTGLPSTEVPLRCENGRYTFDFEAMEKSFTPDMTSFVLCNPHNPVGRVYKREELLKLMDFCVRHHLTIISDEIHCEFIYEGTHIPLFSLNDEAKQNTITISSCAKICNMPMIPIAFTVIPDKNLRKRYKAAIHDLYGHGATLNCLAMEKAYDGACNTWKQELVAYLKENRNLVEARIAGIRNLSITHNEATYLGWIDCTQTGLANPQQFFRETARVYLSNGEEFGAERFVRINYACPRTQLIEALDRMEHALQCMKSSEI